jgi:ParB/RepB/Spo0J family partition protein
MKVEQRPVEEVVPYARNPRHNADAIDKVAASIREYGWQQPIVVDGEMTIIAGHTRYEAAKRLGLTDVPVQVADDLTPAQVRAYRLADNRLHEDAGWDSELLAIELGDLNDEDFELSKTGFDSDELSRIIGYADLETPENGSDAAPAQNECPKCGYQW